MALATFLLKAKTDLLKALSTSQPALIVSGNEAADLDSLASAILYAYLSPANNRPAPLFPIPSADLALRPEIVYLLKQNRIERKDLTFLDDLPKTNSELGLVLVDHNTPTTPLRSISPRWTVKGIIDHHEDAGQHTDASPRVVKVAGSCSSLVTNWFTDGFTKKREAETQLARLALAAIAIDTAGLRRRANELDEQAAKTLKSVLAEVGEEVDMGALADEMQEKKASVGDMSLRDLLRKDYKEWVVEGKKGKVKVGISSLPVNIASVVARFLEEEIDEAVFEWTEEKELDLAIVMTSFMEDSVFRRELAVWVPQHATEQARAFHQSLHELEHVQHLNLEEGSETLQSSGARRVFVQKNVEASRKQVAPAVITALEALLRG